MKINKKYLVALLFTCFILSICLFVCYIAVIFLLSIYFYLMYGDFLFKVEDIYIACKLGAVGIPIGIGIWYLEYRRMRINIYGK
ncbi:hypothetical protein DKK70_00895 [Gilliamella apicola]|uniref:Uncharacterized protein n=1 Tax=Gilliamella apicola TaxID=1196095 RepID=A0A2V4EC88_9GAMM|nr:hypothetical protein [Gilliamella apicola]PXZ08701.1 hypothetical protein DKK70_00895 [Gilliamella apicola]